MADGPAAARAADDAPLRRSTTAARAYALLGDADEPSLGIVLRLPRPRRTPARAHVTMPAHRDGARGSAAPGRASA